MKSGAVDLLEREDALRVLSRNLASVEAGSGRFVLVEGPAGIGKTRLLEEAEVMGASSEARTLTGRGTELEQQFAFGVVRQLFEPLLATASSREKEEWFAGAAVSAEAVLGPVTSLTPGGDFATLHGLYWLTSNISQSRPLVLSFDDLQWADAQSLRFLAYLLPRLDVLPVLVVAATRTVYRRETAHIMEMISADPAIIIVRPQALSQAAAAVLVNSRLGADTQADQAFVSACHDATGGNPLLLRQLAQVVVSEELAPVSANAWKIVKLGPRAVARYVAVRLRELSRDGERIAQSVAVLGNDANLRDVAAHSCLPFDVAARIAGDLQRVNILSESPARPEDAGIIRLNFVHPLVRSAVYGSLERDALIEAHSRAVDILMANGADAEHVAAHLIHTPPSGSDEAVKALREAATNALHRGSPDSAYVYLRRCLVEPPAESDRLDVLLHAGTCAQLFDIAASVDLLRQALQISADRSQRMNIRSLLGGALLYLQRTREALEVYQDGIREAEGDDDGKRTMAAGVLSVTFLEQGRPDLLEYADELERLEPSETLGGRILDSMIAMVRSLQGDPRAIYYARRAIDGGQLVDLANGEAFLPVGVWQPLLAADCVEAFVSIEDAMSRSHRIGSIRALAPASDFRGLGWLWRGYLNDAEPDLVQAKRAIEAADVRVGRSFNGSFRAELFMAQGRLQEAEDALEWAERDMPAQPSSAIYLVLSARARLHRLRHEYSEGLSVAIRAGQRFSAIGGKNPAIVPWRSESALCLLGLGRTDEARQYADREVELARQWKGARALGHALRVAGLAHGRSKGIELLREAVETVASSPARLEYAESLIDLGAALCRAGLRAEAQEALRQGAELAQKCGAPPLVQRGITELKMAGARPRRISLSGPEALTPSERRVAELAGAGYANRDIAQRLFVTVKTVEVHLTSVYRKLNITSREEIKQVMGDASES
ncbi:helix-turn-helix transcriptional regulator [Streptomyces coffeae]|uniref:AAA family ATPase n=1 Tax=Streptomyces coffeae TaxID=621382 RepID=A0ABS1NPI4_9ACTN|nr:AAA family ATPase [Streptomyces coffeae]MBL1102001.1 AAA family ATPase [Streptomyces coffeae]